jgi:hypothetical protein
MVDNQGGSPPEKNDMATFAWLRTPRSERLALRVSYRGVSLRAEWFKVSDEDFDQLIAYLPRILNTARKEREIYEAMQGVDIELEELLGDAE